MLKICGINKQALPEGLKAYAKFDDASNILKDSASGANTDGAWEYSGSLPIYDSKIKKIGLGSAKFSASIGNQYLRTVYDKLPLRFNYPFTIEFFLRESYSYSRSILLLKLYNRSDSSIEYSVYLNPSEKRVEISISGLGNGVSTSHGLALYNKDSGAWNHFVIQYENGIIGVGCNGYIDGYYDFKRYYMWTNITPLINGRPLIAEFTNLATDTWFDNIVIWDKLKYSWGSKYSIPVNGY